MQYIHFAREEPELYRLLFLARMQGCGTVGSMHHFQEPVHPTLKRVYHITDEEAERYSRDLWLVVHSLSTLIVTGGCPYSDGEISRILTGFSVSICKAIKEISGFAADTYDREVVFRGLVEKRTGEME